MDVELLKEGIVLHKKNSPKTYSDDIKMVIPLYAIYQHIHKIANKTLAQDYDLLDSELDVLASLIIGGGDEATLSPTALYDRLLFSSGGMTKILKKLETKEYIERTDDKNDKRSKLVKLTQKGRDLAELALKDVVDIECAVFSSLDKEEKDTFEKLLLKVLENTK